MNPDIVAQKHRYKQQKPPPNVSEMTEQRLKVNANPYAHALATPIRQCQYTRRILPTFFLRSAHLRPHPSTGKHWFVPLEDFTSAQTARTRSAARAERHQKQVEADTKIIGDLDTQGWEERKEKDVPAGSAHPGHAARFVNSAHLAGYLTSKGASAYTKTLPDALERTVLNAAKRDSLVWREDTPDLFAKYSRECVVRALKLLFRRKKGREGEEWVVRLKSLAELESVEGVGCVLHFGAGPERYEKQVTAVDAVMKGVEAGPVKEIKKVFGMDGKDQQGGGPGGGGGKGRLKSYDAKMDIEGLRGVQPEVKFSAKVYPTMEYRGEKVAVYYLREMLGEEGVRDAVKGTKMENILQDGGWVAVKGTTSMTRAAQMHLLRLQGYLWEWA